MKSPHTCYLGVSGQSGDVGESRLMNFQVLKAGNAAAYSNKEKVCSPRAGVGSIPQLTERESKGAPIPLGEEEDEERGKEKVKR